MSVRYLNRLDPVPGFWVSLLLREVFQPLASQDESGFKVSGLEFLQQVQPA
jgi:hypothetical protein